MMRAALALALALTSTGGMASEIAGKATVFDSTTIEIDGQRIETQVALGFGRAVTTHAVLGKEGFDQFVKRLVRRP